MPEPSDPPTPLDDRRPRDAGAGDIGGPTTEAAATRYRDLDTWPLARSLEEIIAGQERAARAVRAALPQLERAAAGIEASLASGGRLVYAGAGTSGRLALQDAAELPPTFGFDRTEVLLAGGDAAGGRAAEGAEDDTGAARRAVARAELGPNDALVAVAASGSTPYTVAALDAARAAGGFTVGVANNPGAPLLARADAPVLLDTGPEVLAGSTRLAAGTAQKAALNALSTAVLVRLGGAYRNLMIGMAPVNAKLRRRAATIVRDATGADEADAAAALERCGGDLRCAVVTLRAGVAPDAAHARLADHGQRVRAALASFGVDDGHDDGHDDGNAGEGRGR